MLDIVDLNKVYDPGFHCAFTDISLWRGRVWLAFREALNHSVHPSSQIVIMSSANHGRSFQVEARISRRGHDVRDPHFFITNDRLHVVIPTWEIPRSKNHRQTFLAVSDNGREFEFAEGISAFDYTTVWRPRKPFAEKAWYAAAYDRQPDKKRGKVRLLRSENGREWQGVSVIHDQEYPNETELCFLPEGYLLALVRREESAGHKPLLAKASFPYEKWDKTECDQFLQGPLLERLGEDRFLVVGRSLRDLNEPDCERKVTRLFSLDIDTGHLEPGLALASGNDTSYAGFVRLPEGSGSWNNGDANALLSYYSGHEYDNGAYRGDGQWQRSAIYVARVVV